MNLKIPADLEGFDIALARHGNMPIPHFQPSLNITLFSSHTPFLQVAYKSLYMLASLFSNTIRSTVQHINIDKHISIPLQTEVCISRQTNKHFMRSMWKHKQKKHNFILRVWGFRENEWINWVLHNPDKFLWWWFQYI